MKILDKTQIKLKPFNILKILSAHYFPNPICCCRVPYFEHSHRQGGLDVLDPILGWNRETIYRLGTKPCRPAIGPGAVQQIWQKSD